VEEKEGWPPIQNVDDEKAGVAEVRRGRVSLNKKKRDNVISVEKSGIYWETRGKA